MTVIPEHLPGKMTICSWIWAWLAQAGPDEPYGDIEKTMIETKERGFNCIRLDAGLNWCFDMQGNPRGEVEFCQWIEGYSSNLRIVNAKGGVKYKVLDRVLQMMELAKKYNIYVILTSWEYQDSTWHISDRKIRDEVMAVPINDRLIRLAHQHDRLIKILKERGLAKNIAFIEPHNELNASDFPGAEENKRVHTEAISFLRERHPDILVSADLVGLLDGSFSFIPDNTQVFDMHMYPGYNVYGGKVPFAGIYSSTIWNQEFDPKNPRKIPLMNKLLKEHIISWDVFMKKAENVREFWGPINWFYENLNNKEWDTWMLDHFDEFWPIVKDTAKKSFILNGDEFRRRDIPAVLDEGGWFYPPLGSRFEEMDKGMRLFDLMCDEAIKQNYWGFMNSTYNGPEQPIWTARPDWLKTINERFQKSIILEVE
ncbi:MAG: cellulase family glycosylhydrolase [Candidatus Omnitrophica bacterium]|nr:cellulase family glycosylhydrolase [Candidatus Omnitrophota bacterium]